MRVECLDTVYDENRNEIKQNAKSKRTFGSVRLLF